MFTHLLNHPPTSSLTHTSEMLPRSRAFPARPRGLPRLCASCVSVSCAHRALTSAHLYLFVSQGALAPVPSVSRRQSWNFIEGVAVEGCCCCSTQPTARPPLPQRAHCKRERRITQYIFISLHSNRFSTKNTTVLFRLLSNYNKYRVTLFINRLQMEKRNYIFYIYSYHHLDYFSFNVIYRSEAQQDFFFEIMVADR